MKIGFFDSGLGGLAILHAVAKHLPMYDYEYYGDTAHLPYGDKSEREIYEYTRLGVEHLFARDCVLVVIACNTASAETLRRLQDEYLPYSAYASRRILGVIIPVVEEVCVSGLERVVLIGTKRTIRSGKYHLELGKRNMLNTKIEAVATPELVPLIEAGNLPEALAIAEAYIEPFVGEVGGVILGCTHYTLLEDDLHIRYPQLKFFSQTDIIPKKSELYLEAHPEIQAQLGTGYERNIYLTEQRSEYDRMIEMLLRGHLMMEQ